MSARKTVPTESLLKLIEAICFALGPAVTAFFLFGITVDQHGYYYRGTELGIAFGVLIISSGFALRYWRR
ncbi:MAG: hypothetical protein V3T33_08650 [Myxococcota bacterium]